ncbi:MAG: type II toxin-antitoxin system VapC family toxin [Gemmatimonadaceae bacterium]
MAELFAFDTNVYIRAQRELDAREALDRFRFRIGPRVRLLAVVAMELRAGARTAELRAGVTALVEAHASRGLYLIPGSAAYVEAGRVIADLAVRERFDVARAAPSFTLDVLIAAACREAGATLVTWNAGDFARIARHLRGLRLASLPPVHGSR